MLAAGRCIHMTKLTCIHMLEPRPSQYGMKVAWLSDAKHCTTRQGEFAHEQGDQPAESIR